MNSTKERGMCTCGTPVFGVYTGKKGTKRDFKPDPHFDPKGQPCLVNPARQLDPVTLKPILPGATPEVDALDRLGGFTSTPGGE